MTTQTNMAMPTIPPEVLAKMPPAQRAQMEERMKAMQGRPTTTKSCVTEEDIKKAFAMGDQQKSCTRTILSSSPTKQEIRIECTTDRSKTSGVMRVEAVNAETVKGSMQMTMTGGAGAQNMTFNNNFTSKWLGPTCDPADKK